MGARDGILTGQVQQNITRATGKSDAERLNRGEQALGFNSISDISDLQEVTLTSKKQNPRIYSRDIPRNQLAILKFPLDIEQGVPYILLKIFETQTGPVEITDPTTISLRTGIGNATAVLSGIPGGIESAAGLAIASQFGVVAGLATAGALTETGQGTIDDIAASTIGIQNFTSQAKDLIKNFALKRNIEQLSLGIALFMPDGLTTNYDNEYDTLSITSTLGAVGFAAQAAAAVSGEVQNMSPYIAEAAAAITGRLIGSEDFARLGLFASTGTVRNPQLEVIYSSPVLRRFAFDFRLIPRDATESSLINNIISRLKYFAAPEIVSGSGGRFLIPPAQFEIEFYDGNNNQNQFLFKTKKCVLTGISLDYSPNGFATHEDGAPVETRMQLNFQETVMIDKNAVNEGY